MGGKKKKKSSKKKEEPKEEEPEEEETSSVASDIEWSFDDDDDDEEDEGKKAKKIPLSPGVRKKIAEMVDVVNRLQRNLVSKEREIYDIKNNLNILSADYQDMSQDLEWHQSENAKKDAIIDKYKKQAARTNEDFDKFRERVKSDQQEQKQQAGGKVIKKVLDIIDNYDKALEVFSEAGDPEYVRGFELIRKQMTNLLESEGVEKIEALNEPFDPKLHDAVDLITDKSVPQDTVIEVSKEGYKLYDMVLRPAIVKVSKGGPKREEKEEEPVKGEKPDDEDEEKPKKEKKGKKKGSKKDKEPEEEEPEEEEPEEEEFEEGEDEEDEFWQDDLEDEEKEKPKSSKKKRKKSKK